MSITTRAKEIMEEADLKVEDIYGENTGFSMKIKRREVIVGTYSARVILKRWATGEKNYHLYSLFAEGGSYVSEGTEKVIASGLEFALKYLKFYADEKKQEGYMIITEKDTKTPEWAETLIENVDKSGFNEESRKLISECFNHFYERFLGGSIGQEFREHFNNVYNATVVIKKFLKENPLCVLKDNVNSLFYRRVECVYQGESIVISTLDNAKMFKISVRKGEQVKEIDGPLRLQELNKILLNIKEENRITNLIQPPTHYFKLFIKTVLKSSLKDDNIQEEFNNIVNYFQGDWEKVELMFKEISPPETEYFNKKDLLETFLENEDKVSKNKLVAYKFKADNQNFSLIVYTKITNVFIDKFKIFAEEVYDDSQKGREFVLEHTKHIMEYNMR